MSLSSSLIASLFPHSDPDSVAFCVLATDEEYEGDIALQIHFTLIQAFCFDNDINVVRVNDIQRLADLVGAEESGEPKDAHCILVTVRFQEARGHSDSHMRASLSLSFLFFFFIYELPA